MNSLRTKLFLNISCLVIFFVFISWALSALALEQFYIWHKKHQIIEAAQLIDTFYNAAPADPNISLELERTANSLGAGLLITDADSHVKYSSFDRIIGQKAPETDPPAAPAVRPSPQPTDPGPHSPPFILKITKEIIDSNSTIEWERDPALNIDFIALRHRLNNNDWLIIKVPLAAVAESASYANNFMILTGLLSIFIGCLWAFIFAKKFTIPLQELSKVAQSISQLDFSQKCTIKSRDEIGHLGQSINNLAEQLDKAISELSRKNQQLLADVEKERRLDKLRKNFISSVSHELKTPLSLILGYAEGLTDNVAQSEESKNYYCSVIIDEAEKMDKLVKDLLNLSQIESGFFHLERTNFNLSLLLDDILQKQQALLQKKHLTLEVEKTGPLEVNGDILRIEQVVINLLNNAIDHAENQNLIRISVQPAGEKIKVAVFNTGQPIPEESLDNLWLSFYKVDQARTRELGGYGLGLSIVRAIQDLHGNGYGVENVKDGVRFWFLLDRAGQI